MSLSKFKSMLYLTGENGNDVHFAAHTSDVIKVKAEEELTVLEFDGKGTF